MESTNFSLNDDEFSKIKELSNQVDSEVLILFWQFAISSLEELDIVSNQHLSIEMFLIRLMYLTNISNEKNQENNSLNEDTYSLKLGKTDNQKINQNNENIETKNKTISQIKNIFQEDSATPSNHKNENKGKIDINSFDDLINVCNQKKEIQLKYELENHVNLVSFETQQIEISFNENLDKDFVKELTFKLHEWTGQRWIIAFSKEIGQLSKKQKMHS